MIFDLSLIVSWQSAKSSIVGDVSLGLGVTQLTGSNGGAYIMRTHGVARVRQSIIQSIHLQYPLQNVSMTSVLFVSGPIQSSAYSLSTTVQHWTTVRDLPGK